MNTVTTMRWPLHFDDDNDEAICNLIERVDELETRLERLEIIRELEECADEDDDDIKTQFQVMKELVKTLMDKTNILQQMIEQMAQSNIRSGLDSESHEDATDEAESESEDSDYVSDLESSEEPIDGPIDGLKVLTSDAGGNAVWSKFEKPKDGPIGLSMYPADGGKQIVITLKGFGLK